MTEQQVTESQQAARARYEKLGRMIATMELSEEGARLYNVLKAQAGEYHAARALEKAAQLTEEALVHAREELVEEGLIAYSRPSANGVHRERYRLLPVEFRSLACQPTGLLERLRTAMPAEEDAV